MDPDTAQTLITLALGFLPEPYRGYAANVLGLLILAVVLCKLFCVWVKPPSADHPVWLQRGYAFISAVALNLGWSRNIVIPGMTPKVQRAAVAIQKVVAAAPALAVVPPTVIPAVPPAVPPDGP